ncbi:MAG: hypothetical protein ISS82_01510 [Nanoarchaeota archaeon]|nr:hypothetical protein [Nanoarchaeota archaeon]
MKSWREKVDPIIKNHLEAQIKETLQHKDAYNQSKDKGKAQLWVAVANLSKQIINLELKIKYIENVLKDMILKLNELKEQKPEKIIKEIEEPKKIIKKKTKKKIKKKKTKHI